jgi:hypothetical protein
MIASILATLATVVLAAIATALYLLPVLLGWGRRVPDIGSVAVINILLGWTLVGWAVALALALRSVNADGPAVQRPPHIPPSPPGPPGYCRPGTRQVRGSRRCHARL